MSKSENSNPKISVDDLLIECGFDLIENLKGEAKPSSNQLEMLLDDLSEKFADIDPRRREVAKAEAIQRLEKAES